LKPEIRLKTNASAGMRRWETLVDVSILGPVMSLVIPIIKLWPARATIVRYLWTRRAWIFRTALVAALSTFGVTVMAWLAAPTSVSFWSSSSKLYTDVRDFLDVPSGEEPHTAAAAPPRCDARALADSKRSRLLCTGDVEPNPGWFAWVSWVVAVGLPALITTMLTLKRYYSAGTVGFEIVAILLKSVASCSLLETTWGMLSMLFASTKSSPEATGYFTTFTRYAGAWFQSSASSSSSAWYELATQTLRLLWRDIMEHRVYSFVYEWVIQPLVFGPLGVISTLQSFTPPTLLLRLIAFVASYFGEWGKTLSETLLSGVTLYVELCLKLSMLANLTLILLWWGLAVYCALLLVGLCSYSWELYRHKRFPGSPAPRPSTTIVMTYWLYDIVANPLRWLCGVLAALGGIFGWLLVLLPVALLALCNGIVRSCVQGTSFSYDDAGLPSIYGALASCLGCCWNLVSLMWFVQRSTLLSILPAALLADLPQEDQRQLACNQRLQSIISSLAFRFGIVQALYRESAQDEITADRRVTQIVQRMSDEGTTLCQNLVSIAADCHMWLHLLPKGQLITVEAKLSTLRLSDTSLSVRLGASEYVQVPFSHLVLHHLVFRASSAANSALLIEHDPKQLSSFKTLFADAVQADVRERIAKEESRLRKAAAIVAPVVQPAPAPSSAPVAAVAGTPAVVYVQAAAAPTASPSMAPVVAVPATVPSPAASAAAVVVAARNPTPRRSSPSPVRGATPTHSRTSSTESISTIPLAVRPRAQSVGSAGSTRRAASSPSAHQQQPSTPVGQRSNTPGPNARNGSANDSKDCAPSAFGRLVVRLYSLLGSAIVVDEKTDPLFRLIHGCLPELSAIEESPADAITKRDQREDVYKALARKVAARFDRVAMPSDPIVHMWTPARSFCVGVLNGVHVSLGQLITVEAQGRLDALHGDGAVVPDLSARSAAGDLPAVLPLALLTFTAKESLLVPLPDDDHWSISFTVADGIMSEDPCSVSHRTKLSASVPDKSLYWTVRLTALAQSKCPSVQRDEALALWEQSRPHALPCRPVAEESIGWWNLHAARGNPHAVEGFLPRHGDDHVSADAAVLAAVAGATVTALLPRADLSLSETGSRYKTTDRVQMEGSMWAAAAMRKDPNVSARSRSGLQVWLDGLTSSSDSAVAVPRESDVPAGYRAVAIVGSFPAEHTFGGWTYCVNRAAELSSGRLSNWMYGGVRFDIAHAESIDGTLFSKTGMWLHHDAATVAVIAVRRSPLVRLLVAPEHCYKYKKVAERKQVAESEKLNAGDGSDEWYETPTYCGSAPPSPSVVMESMTTCCCMCQQSGSDHGRGSSKSSKCQGCDAVAFGACGPSRRGGADATWLCPTCKSKAVSVDVVSARKQQIELRQLAAKLRSELDKVQSSALSERAPIATEEAYERSLLLTSLKSEMAAIVSRLQQRTQQLQSLQREELAQRAVHERNADNGLRALVAGTFKQLRPSPAAGEAAAVPSATRSLIGDPPGPPDPPHGARPIPVSNLVDRPVVYELTPDPLALQQQHFRPSQTQGPCLASIFTGHFLADATLKELPPPETEMQTLTERALTYAVRSQHHQLLEHWKEWLCHHPVMLSEPLSHLAVQFLWERGHQREWQWQTLHRNMCSLVGACSNAPLYLNTDCSIPLSLSAHFRQAMSYVNQRAQQSQPRNQEAVSMEQVTVACEEAPFLWQRVALALMWQTSARVGCILQLEMQDVTKIVRNGVETLSVHFARGKGVKMRGPYTVFAALVEGPWKDNLVAYMRQRQRDGAGPRSPLFPGTPEIPESRRTTALLSAIRAADPALNLRAMRRGSLQAVMAQEGCTIEELMARAGHTNPKTTRRYLAFGLEDVEAQNLAVLRTQSLQPAHRPPLEMS